MSIELETLDQLQGSDLPLATVRGIYPSDEQFRRSIHAMLQCGDIRLLTEGVEVPTWRWRELLVEGGWMHEQATLVVSLTPQGASRVS